MTVVKTPSTEQLWDDMNQLMTSWLRSAEFKFEHLNAYVRADHHLIQQEVQPCFTFSRLWIDDPRKLGKGSFKFMVECVQGFLEVVKDWPKVMYVENCLNERLCKHLKENGWTEVPGGFGSSSFFKRVEYKPATQGETNENTGG